jgi:bis(5'-nucleosyl)-tetraphosphatase (symmetrical)
MSKYAIGDVQGHYEPLMALLETIKFDPSRDELILLGDVVNRGPDSLKVIRFILAHQASIKMVLGNHDLYMLHLYHTQTVHENHTLQGVLEADDVADIMAYFRRQGFLIWDKSLNVVMTHAGIAPVWTMVEAQKYAHELEYFMQTDGFFDWMQHYFDKHPTDWDPKRKGLARYQLIADYFTRMRDVDSDGHLVFKRKAYPWFACPKRITWQETIVFGHWAALKGRTGFAKIQALDTGCHWGGVLTALNLETMERFAKSC